MLTLREDYVAGLDPYAPLLTDKLRARFYMERMGVAAGLDAIRKLPAELCGRPFAEGVAEQLADDLRQVRVPGQAATIPGQYVEPVQLQVVCYQLWANLAAKSASAPEARGAGSAEPAQITLDDLREAGDVNRALVQFYEETLAAVLADPAAAAALDEQYRRAWRVSEGRGGSPPDPEDDAARKTPPAAGWAGRLARSPGKPANPLHNTGRGCARTPTAGVVRRATDHRGRDARAGAPG